MRKYIQETDALTMVTAFANLGRLFLVVLVIMPCSDALTFHVDPAKEECLFEDISSGTKVSGSFQVSVGGHLDIDAKVKEVSVK